jgi:hypothetical protein
MILRKDVHEGAPSVNSNMIITLGVGGWTAASEFLKGLDVIFVVHENKIKPPLKQNKPCAQEHSRQPN